MVDIFLRGTNCQSNLQAYREFVITVGWFFWDASGTH